MKKITSFGIDEKPDSPIPGPPKPKPVSLTTNLKPYYAPKGLCKHVSNSKL